MNPNPKFTGSRYGIYGDVIHELDWSVGELLAALDRHDIANDTLVIFASDNGGVVNPNNQEAQAAIKAGLAINGPLRGGKHDVWEGGFRTPFLVRWPGKVPAGTTSDQVVCHTDLLATLAGILRVPLPEGAGEDSFDVGRAFFESKPGEPVRDHVIVHSADAVYAIRMGNWKLVEREGGPKVEPRRRARPAGQPPRNRPAGRAREAESGARARRAVRPRRRHGRKQGPPRPAPRGRRQATQGPRRSPRQWPHAVKNLRTNWHANGTRMRSWCLSLRRERTERLRKSEGTPQPVWFETF